MVLINHLESPSAEAEMIKSPFSLPTLKLSVFKGILDDATVKSIDDGLHRFLILPALARSHIELAPGVFLHLRGVGQQRRGLQGLRGGRGSRHLLGVQILPGLGELAGSWVQLAGEISCTSVPSHHDTALSQCLRRRIVGVSACCGTHLERIWTMRSQSPYQSFL